MDKTINLMLIKYVYTYPLKVMTRSPEMQADLYSV